MTRPPALDQLLDRLQQRRAVIGVVGLGHVGESVARLAHAAGFPVVGSDPDRARLAALREVLPWLRAGADGSTLAGADALLLCVPTPLAAAGRPDLSQIVAAARAVGAQLQPGALVVLESTVFPGATRGVLLPELLAAARAAGRAPRPGVDLFVAHAPERVDPGRSEPPPERIPRLVGGLDEPSAEAARALYAALVEQVVPCSSAEVAEAAKVFENVFRAVNIALANELEMVLAPLGVPVQEVLDAAATKPFGFMAFRPGAGAGGHCVPAAPALFAEAARRAGVTAPLVAAADAVNRGKPEWIVARTRTALAERRAAQGLPPVAEPLAGARVLVVGLSYKPGVADTRGSPGLQLLALLAATGADVAYHDPLVPRVPEDRPAGVPELESVPWEREALAEFEAIVVATKLPEG